MTEQTITVYRAGSFSTEATPPWLIEIYTQADVLRDWDKALCKVLGHSSTSTSISDPHWTYAAVKTWRTPDGGYYVDLSGDDETLAEVWVPDPADWLPFATAHVEPFLHTRAVLRQTWAIDRLANAVIAYVRHGDGRHIERDSGKSRIDEDADRRAEFERYRRSQEVAAAASNRNIANA